MKNGSEKGSGDGLDKNNEPEDDSNLDRHIPFQSVLSLAKAA